MAELERLRLEEEQRLIKYDGVDPKKIGRDIIKGNYRFLQPDPTHNELLASHR